MTTSVVLGAGGFIGGHLAKSLVELGYNVIGVDVKNKSDWYQIHGKVVDEFDIGEPRLRAELDDIMVVADHVYCLAADMGGMGFIESHKLACMLTAETTLAALRSAHEGGVSEFFYASSACVYPSYRQTDPDMHYALKEEDAYPADPEDGYGWEKLFGERLCHHYHEETDMNTHVARFHNVYGPLGTWEGGREKAPAAMCRKAIELRETITNTFEIWGDGHQTRSFMYIDDCVDGIIKIMSSPYAMPINLGSSELVSINDLAEVALALAGLDMSRIAHIDGPLGVRGRNSDNTLIRNLFRWEPSIPLVQGMRKTFDWIEEQMDVG